MSGSFTVWEATRETTGDCNSSIRESKARLIKSKSGTTRAPHCATAPHWLHEVDVWSWSPLVWHDDVLDLYFVLVPAPQLAEHAPHFVHPVYVP